MSDLFENHIVGFPTRRLHYNDFDIVSIHILCLLRSFPVVKYVNFQAKEDNIKQYSQISVDLLLSNKRD